MKREVRNSGNNDADNDIGGFTSLGCQSPGIVPRKVDLLPTAKSIRSLGEREPESRAATGSRISDNDSLCESSALARLSGKALEADPHKQALRIARVVRSRVEPTGQALRPPSSATRKRQLA